MPSLPGVSGTNLTETVITGYVHCISLWSLSPKITDPARPRCGLYRPLLDSSFTPDQVQQAEYVDNGTSSHPVPKPHPGWSLGCRVKLNAGQEVQELCAQVLKQGSAVCHGRWQDCLLQGAKGRASKGLKPAPGAQWEPQY